jgi:ribosomal protein L14
MRFKGYSLQGRSLLVLLFFSLFHLSLLSQQVARTIPNSTTPEGLIGFLEFKPSDYGTQLHPLIIFLHGIGERGNGTTQINTVANNAIPMLCSKGATMRFTVGGVTSSFVVLSPQLSTSYGYWPPFYVREMIKYAKANLQIDPNRIYITGLSLGGGGTWRAITDATGFDYTFDAGIAAAAPVCGTQEETDVDVCPTIGANHLPIWAFHSMDDATVGVGATQHAEILLNGCNMTPKPKFTYYQSGGHSGAWVNAYDTGHITRTVIVNGVASSFTANPNLYEWLLSNTRGTTSTNTPPIANAGSAQTITLPISTVTLSGSGTGTNGANIVGYSWTKTSGPAGGTITAPGSTSTTVTGLVQGTYVFTLTVTDNNGLSSSANVTITVNPLVNLAPVANAGSNATITLPTNSVTLDGSASSDPDGTIASYSWTKTSGPASGTITTANAKTTSVTGLTQGVYVFNLQVTDNAGATANASVTITVNAAPNQSPVANAGSNTTITLPTNTTTLDGSASSDPDGTIASYNWTKTSGPASGTITTANAKTTSVTGLTQGVYVFNLQVTDNAGATANATVTVTVNAAPNQSPVANAGSNTTITLPANSATLDGSASADPDGTIASYSWTKVSGPAAGSITAPNAKTTTVTGLVQGVYVFNLNITDNAGAAANATVTITVNAPANLPPVANAGSNATITLPTSSVTLSGAASSDPDGSIASYSWTKTSGPAAAVITSPATSNTTVTGLTVGVYVFTLQVTDNNGASASATVTVVVNPAANQAPVANAGNNVIITLPVNSVTLDGTGSSDPDGTIASYSWTKTSGPAAGTISAASSGTTTVTGLTAGVYVFTLQVTDNSGANAFSTVTVTVNPAANQLPIAYAGSDIVITLPVNSVTLNGTGSFDPDGTITSFNWTKSSGPAAGSIVNANVASASATGLVQGVYVFTLQITDNSGATASSNVTVTVNAAANQTPVAYAGPAVTITLPVNSVTLNGSGSFDPDGSITTFSWTKTSGPAAGSIANAGSATATATGLVQGDYVFTLQVTDNSGATAQSSVNVTVLAAPNQAPIANAGNNMTIVLPISTAVLDGSASADPDGTITSYSWTKSSGPAAGTISNPAGANTSVTGLVQGVYVFTLVVTDNNGATASSSVTVTVNPAPNKAPVANAGADISITLPIDMTVLDGSGSYDPDGSIASYSWNKISGSGALTIVNSNTPSPTVLGLSQGQYVFELTVTDNSGATATDQVVVTVNAEPNKAPVANAGKDSSITLPASSSVLSGSGTDVDGTIAQYSWKQLSGPSAALIAAPDAAVSGVSNLIEGEYVFQLTVTDNAGASATATVKITVTNAFRNSEYFRLYPNPATSVINLQYIDDKTGKMDITIYDVNGRVVLTQEVSKDQSLMTKQYDVSKLQIGVYYLEIRQAGGNKLVRPFVKQ